MSLTHKVLTTRQPSYLCDLISVQPPRNTRSSSVVTISRPSTSSTLKITNLSFNIPHPTSGTNFLNHSASLIHISQSLPHSLTSLVMPDHRFHQRDHCHRLSPLLSFTPDSKHTYTDFTVTWPAHWFYLATRGRLSPHWSAFERGIKFYFLLLIQRI